VEGERKADRLRALGLEATCNPFGCKWEGTAEFVEHFRGAEIIILPDHDDPGRAWTAECVRLLTGVAVSVKIVSLGLTEEGADIVDWLDAGHTAEELLSLVDEPAMPAPTHDPYYEQRVWSMPWIAEVTDAAEITAIRVLHADAAGQQPAEEPRTEARETPADKPWGRDPATIPPRQFLYNKHYIRGAVSSTIGAGGRAKTTLSCEEAVSMAVGRDLMTGEPLKSGPLRVWILNGEEVQDESDRKIAAVLQHYKITIADLGGRLWAQSVRDRPMRIATMVKGAPMINDIVVGQMVEFIKRNLIDVFMIDPLVSFHDVPENDNSAMDKVIKQGFGMVAGRTNSAGELFHHPGKPKPGQSETTVEDGRGASAILWAVRSARVLNFMTPSEATQIGIPEEERRRYIRISNGKANMGPVGKATWMKIEVEYLPNGDEVACATLWTLPKPFDGITKAHAVVAQRLAQGGAYRADTQAKNWFGYALGEPFGLDPRNNSEDKAKLKTIIKTWLKNKVLATEWRKDEKRKDKEFIIPGPADMSPNHQADDDDE
jgi:RecA-family ATPase